MLHCGMADARFEVEMDENERLRGKDEMAGQGQGEPVDPTWGAEIRGLLERQPLNPFRIMTFSVLSFRPPCEARPALLDKNV